MYASQEGSGGGNATDDFQSVGSQDEPATAHAGHAAPSPLAEASVELPLPAVAPEDSQSQIN